MPVALESKATAELVDELQRFIFLHPRLTRFLLNPAGLTFVLGWALATGILIGWMAVVVISPSIAGRMLIMTATEFVAGREVAIPAGLYSLALPAAIVFMVAFMTDLVTTMWLYPLFYTFRRRHHGRRTFWGYFFRRMEQDAEKNRKAVEKYGAAGLFLFMLIPFAINGPLIGAILGKLVGVRTRYILPTVVLATLTATLGWTLAWMFFQPQVQSVVDRFGGYWIAAAIILAFSLVVGRTVVGFVRDLKEYRAIESYRQALAARLEAGTVSHTIYAEAKAAEVPTAANQTASISSMELTSSSAKESE